MTPNDFRNLALELPGTTESEHMDHPDFRVSGKIFATLLPDGAQGMVMLTTEEQKSFVSYAKVFVPAKGAWGRRGCTQVLLKAVKASVLRNAITSAWRNKASRKLVGRFDEGEQG